MPEPQIESTYVLNFIHLTDWPAAALGDPPAPFRVCVAAGDSFVMSFQATVQGESINGHPLAMQRVGAESDPKICQVLFISRDAPPAALGLLTGIGRAPILVIGNTDKFLDSGGMIAFVRESGHVRFDVNRKEAAQHGLTLSSKLLRIARTVK